MSFEVNKNKNNSKNKKKNKTGKIKFICWWALRICCLSGAHAVYASPAK